MKALNESMFTVVIVALTVALLAFAPGMLEIKDILLLKLSYIALFLTVTFGLIFFLRGTDCDVLHEIFADQNPAAALFVGALMIAVAMVIGK